MPIQLPFASAQETLDAILKIEQGGQGIPAAHAVVEKLIANGTSLETVIEQDQTSQPGRQELVAGIGRNPWRTNKTPLKTKALLEKLLADPKGGRRSALRGPGSPGRQRSETA